MGEHDDRDPAPRPPGRADGVPPDQWGDLRPQVALLLMFFGVVALLSLLLDQFFDFQRPTRPLAALTLGPALLLTGYVIDRGAIRFLLTGGRRPPNRPAS